MTYTDQEKRLRGRGTEAEDQIQTRLHNAIKEMEHIPNFFDCEIINDVLDTSVTSLETTLKENTILF